MKIQLKLFPVKFGWKIFSYFDGQSLLQSFSQLNSFIQCLLNDHSLQIHCYLNLSNLSLLSSFHSNQISSLTIDYSLIPINENLPFHSFCRLRSLHLIHINDKQLKQLTEYQWKSLVQLSVRSKCAKYLLKIICIYFPSIPEIKLHSNEEDEFLLKCFNLEKQKSQVKKLTLDGTIKFSKLFRLSSWVRIFSMNKRRFLFLFLIENVLFRFHIFIFFQ